MRCLPRSHLGSHSVQHFWPNRSDGHCYNCCCLCSCSWRCINNILVPHGIADFLLAASGQRCFCAPLSTWQSSRKRMRFPSILRPSGKKCLGTRKFLSRLQSVHMEMMCRIALEIQLIFSTFIPIFSVIMIHPIRFFPFPFPCCHVCTALSRCHVVTARSRASRARRRSQRRIWIAWSGAFRAEHTARRRPGSLPLLSSPRAV